MMPSTTKNKLPIRILIKVLVIVFWLGVWQFLSYKVNKQIILPSPIDIIKRIGELSGEKAFRDTVISSVGRIYSGLLLGVAAGLVLGVLSALSVIIRELVTPIMHVVKATPVASFIILALIWLKGENVPAFAAFLMVLPIICESTYTGITLTDSKHIEVARVFGFSKFKTLRSVYIPSLLPYFTASLKTSMGLAWKAGIAAEVLCTPRNSIGRNIYEAKIYIETVDVFAWTAVVIIMSFIIEKIVSLLFRGRIFRKAATR